MFRHFWRRCYLAPLFLVALVSEVSAQTFSAPSRDENSVPVDVPVIDPAIRSALESIAHNYLVEIKSIFKQACFDCHTSLTDYPWYYSIPGVKGKIDHDIAQGREHLDFSNDYPFLSQREITQDLKAIARTIKEKTMPPLSYSVMHLSKSLTPQQKEKVLQWVDHSLVQLNNAGYVASAD